MSKTLPRSLLIALLVFTGLGLLNCSQTRPAPPDQPQAQANKSPTVEVTFDGIMVFRRVGDHYEVGILDKDTAVDHEFRIVVGDNVVPDNRIAQLMNSGNIWSLDVVDASGQKRSDIKSRQVKPCNRLQDTAAGQVDRAHLFDFCWIMDLEGEFHDGQTFDLIPGKLKPIIHLNNGELYTKYNFDELERAKGHSTTYSDFGFVADMVALTVDLKDDERLVMTVAGQEVFSLTPNGVRSAGIFNAPKKNDSMDTDSHFHYYYDLFRSVPESEKYDLRLVEESRRRHPLNRYSPKDRSAKDFTALDDIRIRTFDNQMCGAVLLGKSTDPLR